MRAGDLRAFRWPLHSVGTKLQVDVECARLELARSQRQASTQRKRVENLEDLLAREQLGRATSHGATLDLGRHARSLRFLARTEAALQEQRAKLDATLGSVDAAKQACLAAQRRLESHERLRGVAQGEYLKQLERGNAKEADALWLTRRARDSGGLGSIGEDA